MRQQQPSWSAAPLSAPRSRGLAVLATWVALAAPGCRGQGGPSSVGTDAPGAADAAATDVLAADGASPDGDVPTAVASFPPAFRLGAATSAHQVEGGQQNDWTLWETLPQFAGHTVEPSGQAVDHWTRYAEDLDLAAWVGLDVYRLSVEWSRIEPVRGAYDEQALAHYRAVLEAMAARGLSASVTLHHFSEPRWLTDLTKLAPPVSEGFCPDGPSDEDLCFWSNPQVPDVFGAFCGRVAAELGDLVDEWMTVNELTGYWLGSSVMGDFPPGLTTSSWAQAEAIALPILRGLLAGHAACYRAIHAADTVDADGDGAAARVGLTTGTGAVRPADPGDEEHVRVARVTESLATFLAFDAAATGLLDADLDGEPEEAHPEWAGTLDLLGLQYYASTVIIPLQVHPLLEGTPCINLDDELLVGLLEDAGCPPAPTPDFPMNDEPAARVYGKQHDPEGLLEVLRKLHQRYPALPVVITEHGYADDDVKRAASLVRHLAVCHQAVAEGLPLEGYYHWSLLDNFEWGRGFGVRFGLFAVDRAGDLARSPTVAADVYREITAARGLTAELLARWGGSGPLPTAMPGARAR